MSAQLNLPFPFGPLPSQAVVAEIAENQQVRQVDLRMVGPPPSGIIPVAVVAGGFNLPTPLPTSGVTPQLVTPTTTPSGIQSVYVANPTTVSATVNVSGISVTVPQPLEVSGILTVKNIIETPLPVSGITPQLVTPTTQGSGIVPVVVTNPINLSQTLAVSGVTPQLVAPIPLPVSNDGTVDANNSTTTPLAGGATFTGTAVNILSYGVVSVLVNSDVASATDGLRIEFSSDGINWDQSQPYTFDQVGTGDAFITPAIAKYYRVVYTNGGAAQAYFRLQSVLRFAQQPGDTVDIADVPIDDQHALLTKAVISGHTTAGGGAYVDVKVTPAGAVSVDSSGSLVTVSGIVSLTPNPFPVLPSGIQPVKIIAPFPIPVSSVTSQSVSVTIPQPLQVSGILTVNNIIQNPLPVSGVTPQLVTVTNPSVVTVSGVTVSIPEPLQVSGIVSLSPQPLPVSSVVSQTVVIPNPLNISGVVVQGGGSFIDVSGVVSLTPLPIPVSSVVPITVSVPQPLQVSGILTVENIIQSPLPTSGVTPQLVIPITQGSGIVPVVVTNPTTVNIPQPLQVSGILTVNNIIQNPIPVSGVTPQLVVPSGIVPVVVTNPSGAASTVVVTNTPLPVSGVVPQLVTVTNPTTVTVSGVTVSIPQPLQVSGILSLSPQPLPVSSVVPQTVVIPNPLNISGVVVQGAGSFINVSGVVSAAASGIVLAQTYQPQTLQSAVINASVAPSLATIIPAIANQSIKIYGLSFILSNSGVLTLEDGTTPLTGPMSFLNNAGMVSNVPPPAFIMKTSQNTPFNILIGTSGVTVAGWVNYWSE